MAASAAAAQRSDENAVKSADDAFGSTVGNERTGIYSETDVRGFSPIRAGNLRVEGIYFDQQSNFSSRVRAGSRIRVGIAALDYPFPAPTGIVDHQLRLPGDKQLTSFSVDRTNYGGTILELDTQIPIAPGQFALSAGIAFAHNKEVDGSQLKNYAVGIIPRWRFEGGEFSPFLAHFGTRESTSRIVVTAPGAFVPTLPKARVYLGQDWARASSENTNFGFVTKVALSDSWSVRGGLSESRLLKHSGYSEIFTVADAAGDARHRIIADPRQENRSIAGEVQAAWRIDTGRIRHSVLFMVRGRDKIADSGGSDSRDLGTVLLGAKDPEPKIAFNLRSPDRSHVKQVTAAVGYMGKLDSIAQVNLGLQKVDYRAAFRRPGQPVTSTRDQPWLYNATFTLTPSKTVTAYGAYVTGLEESGVAPENATNRNEVLPASKTEQIDGGVRIKLGPARVVASIFQITKPNFSFDAAGRFVELGQVRHRGVEGSLAGKFGGLELLAGAVLMDPVVTGEAVTQGRVGRRPVGITKSLLRLDADYTTPIKGVSLNLTATHSGPRTASARTYAELGGRQLEIGATTVVDAGVRYRFSIDKVKLSLRAQISNVFNDKSWRIVAANSYQMSETRRVAVFLVGDF